MADDDPDPAAATSGDDDRERAREERTAARRQLVVSVDTCVDPAFARPAAENEKNAGGSTSFIRGDLGQE